MSDFETKVYSLLVVELRRETGATPDGPNQWDYSNQPLIMLVAEEAVQKARNVVAGRGAVL